MRTGLFSFVRMYETSVVASVRIARFVAKTLGVPIYDRDASVGDEPHDVLIIVGGAYAFAGNDVLAGLGRAIESSGRVIWIQNDYTVIPPKDESGAESPFRKAFVTRRERKLPAVDFWSTCELMASPGRKKTGHVCGDGSLYVNWNCLTLDVQDVLPVEVRPRLGTLVYYGSFRKDRQRAFDRYFAEPVCDVALSCPNDKFASYASARITHLPKFDDLKLMLRAFGLGIYLEDAKSHVEYHSPANRFYEMLGAGLGVVFEPEAQRTLWKAGYDVSDHIAWNSGELPDKLATAQQIADDQRERFLPKAQSERLELPDVISTAWRRYS